MMEWIKNILVAVFGLVSLIATPLAIVKTDKAMKESTAKVEAETSKAEAETGLTEAQAELDLIEKMEEYACSTEHGFETFDKVAKANGGKCSVMKKEWLLMKLQNYAMLQGYSFDPVKWGQKLESFIGRTVEINSKK